MTKIFLTVIIGILSVSSAYAQTWRIMPLGNSITKGIHGSSPTGGYRDDLYLLLQNAGINFNFVGTSSDGDATVFDTNHQGTGGIRADDLLANLNTWLSATNPQIILLHIGTNDISQFQTVNSTLDDVEQILTVIVNFNSNITILLASIVPRLGTKNVATQQFNQGIAALVTQKINDGVDVVLVPINEAFLANNNWETEYMDDNVHPNNTGYGVMAAEWFTVLNSLLGGSSGNGSSEIQIVSGNNQSGVVGDILGLPLRIKVVDSNQNPVNDVVMRFDPASESGFLLPDLLDNFLVFEAEESVITPPMVIASDGDASGGEYAFSPVKSQGKFQITFEITEENDYWLWGRVYSLSGLEDSFFFTMSSSTDTFLVDTNAKFNEWYWQEFKHRNVGRIFYHLTPGIYQLSILCREDNTRLDKIIITDNSSYVPQSLDGFPEIRTNSSGEAIVYWQLGSKVGLQQVEVTSPEISGQSEFFNATAIAANPQDISIAGTFTYFSNNQPIANIQLTLNNSNAAISGPAGNYIFSGLPQGEDYTVQPDSQGINQSENNFIISFDAALAARHAIGLDTLASNPQIAADVNRDGQILMFDAALIARYAVGLEPFSESYVGEWVFQPENLTYAGLQTSVIDANFVGIIRGDVHGGFSQNQSTFGKSITSNILNQSSKIVGNSILISIPISSDETIFSFDFELIYSPHDYKLVRLNLAEIEDHFTINSNINNDYLKIGGYNVNGLHDDYYVELEYELINHSTPGSIRMKGFRINDRVAQNSEFQPELFDDYSVPLTFKVLPSYPNPFRGSTQISFYLPEASRVGIKLFNILGQEVWQMTKMYDSPGFHSLKIGQEDFYGKGFTSGIYFLSVQQNNNQTFIQKLRLIK